MMRKSLALSLPVYLLIGFLLMTIGLSVSKRVHRIDPNLALIEGFSRLLPAGFLGLVLFFAAIMSSADSYLFAGISILLIGTLFLVIIEPVNETLVLKAIIFTILGFFAGSLLHWLSEKNVTPKSTVYNPSVTSVT